MAAGPAEILVATGPESCGKSTLCTQLARHCRLPLVSEAARGYLDARLRLYGDYRYTLADIHNIAQIQHAAEILSFDRQHLPLICDTDLLVLIIWSEEKFGEVTPWITQTFQAQSALGKRHYLLCDWQIPWQHDPLRENRDDRERLFKRYRARLDSLALPYTVLSGSPEARLEQALALAQPAS